MAITWNIDEARATIRAQMAEANRLDEVIDDLSAETSAALARAEAAEAEVGRLQTVLDQWERCGNEVMLCATGRAAPLSDSDVCGEIARRRTQVATMAAELAMTSNALRVTQDSVLRNIDRADVAEAEVKRLRAQVVTLEALWQRAIDADLLDDPHELGNAIADASALLNYTPPGDDD